MATSICLVIWLSAATVVRTAPDFDAKVKELVTAGMSARRIPAVSLAVVKDGSIVLAKGYGVKDVESGVSADENTLFGLASCTKAFTTTTLIKLLRNLNSSLDVSTKLQQILGSQAKFNNSLLSSTANLEDLMTHSMGVPRSNFMRLDTDLTRENLMSRLQYLPQLKKFRHSFVYNDLMFGLLAHITEVLSGPGRSWEDVVTDELFRPLAMNDSSFMNRVNFSEDNVAAPYSSGKNTAPVKISTDFIRTYCSLGGSGSIMSTASDMSRYLLFLLAGGKNQQGQQVVEKLDLEKTFTPVAALTSSSRLYPIYRPLTPVTMSTDGYGLGWRTGYYRGYRMLQHTGSTFGYQSMITVLPQTSSAIFTSLSGDDPGYNFRAALHCAILDLTLGLDPWINSTTIATFPAPWVRTARVRRHLPQGTPVDEQEAELRILIRELSQSSRASTPEIRHFPTVFGIPLVNFTGTFVHGAFGQVKIVLDQQTDTLKMTYGLGVWDLNASGTEEFLFDADWFGPAPIYDLQIRFLVRDSAYGFLCLDCDPSYIPAFYRHG